MHSDDQAHPFRDGTAGVEAKRRKLLTDRRDDLATMNHEIRRVYVARLSNLSATLALSLGGALLVLASYSSALGEFICAYMPGNAPAPLSTLLLSTWLLAALAFLGGRALAEHRFNLAMSRAVLPTNDPHVDVARLSHEAPDTVGRRLARRLETPSRMGSILAAGLVMPASALVGLLLIKAGGYPQIDQLENSLASEAVPLMGIALLALIGAAGIAIRPNLRSFTMLSFGVACCESLAIGTPSFFAVAAMSVYLLPAAMAIAMVNMRKTRIQRRQNSRIEQEGAPLPPVFALRKRLARARASIAELPSLLTRENLRNAMRTITNRLAARAYRPSVPQLLAMAMLAGGAAAIAVAIWPSHSAQASESTQARAIPLVNPPSQQSYASRVDDGGEGALIDLHFQNKLPVDASYLLGGAFIPGGWRATITITRVAGDGSIFVQALPENAYGNSPRQLTESNPSVTIEQINCGPFEMPLELIASAYGDWADDGSAELRYQVRMELVGSCSLAGLEEN